MAEHWGSILDTILKRDLPSMVVLADTYIEPLLVVVGTGRLLETAFGAAFAVWSKANGEKWEDVNMARKDIVHRR